MKTVRFAKMVEQAGNPEPYTLWQDPADDRDFQKAVRDERVVTVIREPASTKADAATVGYTNKPGALYLLFPKSLTDFKDHRIVGLKYELLTESKPKGELIKVGEARKPAKPSVKPPRFSAPRVKPAPQPEHVPEPPKPKPIPRFRVDAQIITTRESTLEVEAKNQSEARRIALKQLEEHVGGPDDNSQVKIKSVSKLS